MHACIQDQTTRVVVSLARCQLMRRSQGNAMEPANLKVLDTEMPRTCDEILYWFARCKTQITAKPSPFAELKGTLTRSKSACAFPEVDGK